MFAAYQTTYKKKYIEDQYRYLRLYAQSTQLTFQKVINKNLSLKYTQKKISLKQVCITMHTYIHVHSSISMCMIKNMATRLCLY